jgi:cell division protein FtsL
MRVVKENFHDEKEPFNSLIPLFFWGGLLGLVFCFLCITTINVHSKNAQLQKHSAKLAMEIEQLKTEQSELQKETTALNNDPFYVESLMRNNLKMRKPEELVIQKD